MVSKKGALAMWRKYPELAKEWARNGLRAARGLPMLPVSQQVPPKATKASQVEVQHGGSGDIVSDIMSDDA